MFFKNLFKKENQKTKPQNSSSEKVSTKTLSGFMELLPAEQIKFNQMLETIKESYESFGFIPLDSPVLEKTEILLAKAGGDTEKQIYKFKKGDTDLAMRFDLTVPLARYVAENWRELAFPFRRYAIGKVYRGERAQAGRFREFYQCDIDIVGDEKLNTNYDAEIPSIIYNTFKKLGFDNFTIKINNRKIFNGLLASLEISDKEQVLEIIQILDKLEKLGEEKVQTELSQKNLSSKDIEKIFDFIKINGNNQIILEKLKNLKIENEDFKNGLGELEKVISFLEILEIPAKNFKIDLKIFRGLDYYTGTIYETQFDDYPEIGSVCSGGRYDKLASQYSDKNFPGVGISIGLTRLFDQLLKKGVIQAKEKTKTKVLILPLTKDLTKSIELTKELRTKRITTEISFDTKNKIKKRLGYADKLGIPFVVFIGEDEIAKNIYTLKNMQTGEQKELNKEELFIELLLSK